MTLISTSLCFFAGIKRTKLDDLDILTVRLSNLLTFVGEYINFATHAPQEANPLPSLIGSGTDLTQRIRTYSVYSVYVMNYCEVSPGVL